MKNPNKQSALSTIGALLFFAAMTALGNLVAQTDTTRYSTANPLISTTGPNVLGAGHLLLQGSAGANLYGGDILSFSATECGFNGNLQLRYGVGNKAELTVGLTGERFALETTSYDSPSTTTVEMSTICPSVGARLKLFDGRGILPAVAFFTEVGYALGYSNLTEKANIETVQPTIGLQMRNQISRRWLIDYSIGYSWNSINDYSPLRYSLSASWLASDRWMIGAGIENSLFHLRASYRATDKLMLSAQGLIGNPSGAIPHLQNTHLTLGLNWIIK